MNCSEAIAISWYLLRGCNSTQQLFNITYVIGSTLRNNLMSRWTCKHGSALEIVKQTAGYQFVVYIICPVGVFLLSSMYFGAVQICGERVGTSETKDFCEALDAHKIKMLSLRECGISTKNFKKLTDSLAYCQSILHLNFNLCGIHCQDRVDMLAAALNMNRSLTALL